MKKNKLISLSGSILNILLTLAMLAFASVFSVQAEAEAKAQIQKDRKLPTPQLIMEALKAGEIDQDTANLYLAYSLADYDRLPMKYHSDVLVSGTMVWQYLNRQLQNGGAQSYKNEISNMLLSGTCGDKSDSLPHILNTTHFHIEYGTIGAGLTVTDYANALEASWTKEIDTFGWPAPPVLSSNPPPGNRYHVRILDTAPYAGVVHPTGVHAGFVGNNPNTVWNDADAWATCMLLDDDDVGGLQYIGAIVAHEVKHTIQLGIGASGDASFNFTPNNFIEGGAAWMEDEVSDSSNSNYFFLWPNFDLPMSDYPDFPYSYWITFRGLTERYGTGVAGGGEQVMQDFWEILSQTNGDEIAALNAALGNRGTNLNDAFHAYAIAVKFNKTCGGNFVYPYCFEEAANYVATAGPTVVHGSIGLAGGSFSGNIPDSYAINWVSLPTGSGTYSLLLQNTSAGGSLRGSVVCSTASQLTITPFASVLGAGGSSAVSFNSSGCSEAVAVLTNQSTATPSTARSYTLSTCTPNIQVTIAGSPAGMNCVSVGSSIRQNFPGVDNGPVKVMSTNGTDILAALRVIWKEPGFRTSYSEMMGLPTEQLSTEYWFPWYNNASPSSMDQGFRIANVNATGTNTIQVSVGDSLLDSFNLGVGASIRVSYPIDIGPIRISCTTCTGSEKIIAALRIIWKEPGVRFSYSEMMGLPKEQLSSEYWFPWYNNATNSMNQGFRIANMDTSASNTIEVWVRDTMLDSFTLGMGASTRVSYPIDNGPIRIVCITCSNTGSDKIIAALRVIWQEPGFRASYSEMMGLPTQQLSTQYWFPWYNNTDTTSMDQGFRIAQLNATGLNTIKVMAGTTELDSIVLGTLATSTRVSYPANMGPISIFCTTCTGDEKIIAALRVIWKEPGFRASYSEMMGLPHEALSTEYWFPWYNNATSSMDQGFRIAVP